jgi:hypothetical protein
LEKGVELFQLFHDMSGALRVRWRGGGIPENTTLAVPYLRKRL